MRDFFDSEPDEYDEGERERRIADGWKEEPGSSMLIKHKSL